MPATLAESMVRGTTYKFRVEVINERTDALANIGTWQQFWCTVKAAKTDADGDAALQLTSPSSGIAVVDAANGLLEVTIPDTAFSSFAGTTTHFYLDVKGRDADGLHWALAIGRLTVTGEVTQSS